MVSTFAVVLVILLFIFFVLLLFLKWRLGGDAAGDGTAGSSYVVVPDRRIRDATIENFLREIAREKPIRFTPRQLRGFTRNYSSRLGAGGFGTVYRGDLPNGLAVAIKVLHPHGGRSSAEQFMAEVATIGRTHHINLVRLFGFCYDGAVRALVYEYMEHGTLDAFLLHGHRHGSGRDDDVGVQALRDIAVGVAKGIRYLHEECHLKIVHHDIKPGNVLLDGALTPKVADFGLARLVDRDDTHVSVSGVRGTPGYAAPEMWMQSGVTEKCDVYSFGMLLLELVGRRRNFDEAAPESRRWFPKLAWAMYEGGDLMDLAVTATPSLRLRGDTAMAVAAEDGEDVDDARRRCRDKETVERMCKVAFWCVQQQPEARPPMGAVVKMLEGEMEIVPPVNPFLHLVAPPSTMELWTMMLTSGTNETALANAVSASSDQINSN